MKEQLSSVVLQMYRGGMRCSEAVREFQKTFILTVLKDQRGNHCKAAERLGIQRNTLGRAIRALERLTSARHVRWGGGDQCDRRFPSATSGNVVTLGCPARLLSLLTWRSTRHR
jgi:hypothetical protein